jgi:hypothetical protein
MPSRKRLMKPEEILKPRKKNPLEPVRSRFIHKQKVTEREALTHNDWAGCSDRKYTERDARRSSGRLRSKRQTVLKPYRVGRSEIKRETLIKTNGMFASHRSIREQAGGLSTQDPLLK